MPTAHCRAKTKQFIHPVTCDSLNTCGKSLGREEERPTYEQGTYSLTIQISRQSGQAFVVWSDKLVQANHLEDKDITSIYRQNMELFMTAISQVYTRYQIPHITNSWI